MIDRNSSVEELSAHLRELRSQTGMTKVHFSEYFGIPLRTMEDWEAERRKMPDYLLRLMEYKLRMEKMI